MTSFLFPGVYTAESLGPLTASAPGIAGEAVAAFAAAYNIGPTVPTFIASWQDYVTNYGTFAQAGGSALHYAVYTYFANGGTGCFVLRVPNTDAVTASLGLVDLTVSSPPTIATISANAPGAWGNGLSIEIVSAGTAQHVNLNVYYGGTTAAFLVETFLNVSANPADPRYIASIVNSPVSGSNYITIAEALPSNTYVSGTTDYALISPTALASGADGSSAPSLGSTIPTMFDQYCQQQILNMNLPGVTSSSTLNTLISWAAGREDVFLVIDGPAPSFPETSAQVVTNYTSMLSGGSSVTASSFAAIYAPWVNIQDPSSSNPGATRFVPPGGTVLGAYSTTDTQAGVQQVAAGTNFGQIQAVSLEVNFSPTDLATLNVANINAIRNVPGAGACIMGARTLLNGFPDMFVPIRRVLMKIEHDCVALTSFALFQPNDQNLWDNIATVLTNYLTQQTLAGLLASTDVTSAFAVTCDSTVNSPATAQAGIVNAQVAVALGSPAEFILITISQLQSGAVATSSASTSS